MTPPAGGVCLKPQRRRGDGVCDRRVLYRRRCGFNGTLAGGTPAPKRLGRTVQQAQRFSKSPVHLSFLNPIGERTPRWGEASSLNFNH